ncbi:hypothetical protein Q5H91_09650 [Sphingomonas sp. KR1UV-12]|uniref:Glycosyltransferase RgtA/B/C/D-like domain-containing protein n=1 Tax=Sphingomonas aurea TaxID=3063994 RepID=A0ABT9EKH8_9SPHN|nr:hypothetical protein [Sphingomonas sp. KR1UV-12]MDP1027475.1 hypothetical protein [Sphingomonas sp. KR1UV-12]
MRPQRWLPVAALAVAALLLAGTLALFWPGFVEYDSVRQYEQLLTGRYDDWHPPAMARFWAGLRLLFGAGAGPMLVAQLGGYWLGLGLLSAALARRGRSVAGAGVLAIGLWPVFLGWQVAILKDGQQVAAMLAAVGLIGWWRLAGQRLPWAARTAVAVLLIYALLVRANAVFAVAPLVALTLSRGRRLVAGTAIVAATLALSPIVNHRLLGAEASRVTRTQPLYDLAGIAVRSPGAGAFTGAEALALRRHGCVTPFFWDPLDDVPGCSAATARIDAWSAGQLYAALARAVLLHPIAYAQHRLAHLNSTDRWLVPYRWPGAEPPMASEPNALGLVPPGGSAIVWQTWSRPLATTPAGWPVLWIVAGVAALIAGRARSDADAALARALIGSALMLEASFAVVSIASDLRYHLWPMLAIALGLVLLGRGWSRRRAGATLLAMLLVTATGAAARLLLPADAAVARIG